VEIEKFIELAYSREDEEPTPWLFEDLKLRSGPASFYPASKFKLYGRQPLKFMQRESGALGGVLSMALGGARAKASSGSPPPTEDLQCSSNYVRARLSLDASLSEADASHPAT